MSEDSPIVVTLKGGAGYDAPWLVIRGNTPDQVSSMLANLGNLPEVIAQQASLFTGTINAGPIAAPPPPAPIEPVPPQQAAWGTISPQGFQPAQQGQQWSQPPQQPRQQGSRPGAVLHPENRQCDACGKVLEQKETSNGNKVFRCPDWRWNNGSPNNHTSLRPGQ